MISDNSTQGRFVRSIKSTISGFLKLLYLGKDVNTDIEMEEIEKIIVLSILGKYSIFHNTLETSESKVEVYYDGKKKMTVDIKNLINDYIQSRENKYFEPKLEKDLIEENIKYQLQWENDSINSLVAKKILRKYRKDKITSYPEVYIKLLQVLQDYEIEEKYKEFYRIVVTYDINDYLDEYYSEEIQKERDEFLHAYAAILLLLYFFSEFCLHPKIYEFIKKFIFLTKGQNKLDEWDYSLDIKNKKIREIIIYEDIISQMSEGGIDNKLKAKEIKMKLFEFFERINNNIDKDVNEKNEVDGTLGKKIKYNLKQLNILNSNTIEVIANEKGITKIYFISKKEKATQKTLHEELMNL